MLWALLFRSVSQVWGREPLPGQPSEGNMLLWVCQCIGWWLFILWLFSHLVIFRTTHFVLTWLIQTETINLCTFQSICKNILILMSQSNTFPILFLIHFLLSYTQLYFYLQRTDTLLIDYQFTFSLSQEDDRYYTAINFVATPDEVRYAEKASLFRKHMFFSFFFPRVVHSWLTECQ